MTLQPQVKHSTTEPLCFSFSVLRVVFFIFIQILIYRPFCKQTMETLIRHCSAASDLGLHRFPMFHKKDARLILVKQTCRCCA